MTRPALRVIRPSDAAAETCVCGRRIEACDSLACASQTLRKEVLEKQAGLVAAAQARWAPVFDSVAHAQIDSVRVIADKESATLHECGLRLQAALVACCRAGSREAVRDARRFARLLTAEYQVLTGRHDVAREIYNAVLRAGGKR